MVFDTITILVALMAIPSYSNQFLAFQQQVADIDLKLLSLKNLLTFDQLSLKSESVDGEYIRVFLLAEQDIDALKVKVSESSLAGLERGLIVEDVLMREALLSGFPMPEYFELDRFIGLGLGIFLSTLTLAWGSGLL